MHLNKPDSTYIYFLVFEEQMFYDYEETSYGNYFVKEVRTRIGKIPCFSCTR